MRVIVTWIARIFLVLVFSGLFLIQTLVMPMVAADNARFNPSLSYLELPLLIASDLIIVSCQVIVFAIIMLLRARGDTTTTIRKAVWWITIIFCAALIGLGISTGVLLYLLSLDGQVSAHFMMLWSGAVLGGSTFAILMWMMRKYVRRYQVLAEGLCAASAAGLIPAPAEELLDACANSAEKPGQGNPPVGEAAETETPAEPAEPAEAEEPAKAEESAE